MGPRLEKDESGQCCATGRELSTAARATQPSLGACRSSLCRATNPSDSTASAPIGFQAAERAGAGYAVRSTTGGQAPAAAYDARSLGTDSLLEGCGFPHRVLHASGASGADRSSGPQPQVGLRGSLGHRIQARDSQDRKLMRSWNLRVARDPPGSRWWSYAGIEILGAVGPDRIALGAYCSAHQSAAGPVSRDPRTPKPRPPSRRPGRFVLQEKVASIGVEPKLAMRLLRSLLWL